MPPRRHEQKQIRVVVVDDSAFMRKAISMMLESDPAIKVVGTAANGEDAIDVIRRLKPDLATMDVEMPRMDGLTALRRLMETDPLPVMMVSSITTEGAAATLDALDLGAVDFIPKQSSYVSLDIVKIRDDLLAKIKNIVARKHVLMARLRERKRFTRSAGISPVVPPPAVSRPVSAGRKQHHVDIVAIGSSTGGPPALHTVLSQLPGNLPAGIVIAQHMPPMFTKTLAERLNTLSQLQVKEAVDGDPVEPGHVLISPGGKHLVVRRYGGRIRASVTADPPQTLYKPCVDVLFDSAAETCGQSTLGVVLTGMGTNGVKGAQRIKSQGGVVIAQDEATCVVYGMPRAVVEARLADHIVPLESIAPEIASYF
ncbi:MAG: chemotaxis response regulator protein-glutamate methylesterase [Candidatus Zixiibacteriota bacterium]